MKLLPTTLELLSMPWLCGVLAAGLLVVWLQRRAYRYVLWQALGMLLLALAYALAPQAPVPWSLQVMVVWMLWGAAWALAQAMVAHYGQSVNVYVVVSSAGCVLAATWMGAAAALPAPIRGVVGSMAMGLVLAYALPLAWRGAVRHQLDQWLRCLYSGFTAWVLLGALLLSPSVFTDAALLLAALCSVTMAWCAWRDGATKPRNSGYRDVVTNLLNRSGLDVVCGALPAASRITVVVLCELKDKNHPRYAMGACSALALQCFAQWLLRSVREGDFVARIGSQEFALALRDLDMAQAQALVQRIQAGLPRFASLDNCRASFGLAQVHEMDSLDTALHRADVALYQSKEEAGHSEPLASVV